ncbi:hypothetical protein [Burkholderia ambifaria]|uniref:hypothetical protein n=1 Tax=Burkholderia ambifaria TaxID=152480 RepID=UPI00158A469A|nr:hypothetical protein [Burkholderia ambifaria]
MTRVGAVSSTPFDTRGSRGRSDRGAAPKCDAHRTGGRRSAHRRRRPGIRGMCRPEPAGFTGGRAVAGPPLFVPSAGRREMARGGYRLLVRLRVLHRNIPGAYATTWCRMRLALPSGHEYTIFVATLSSETVIDPFLFGNDR